MLPNYVKDNDQFDKISKFTISNMKQIKKKIRTRTIPSKTWSAQKN